DRDSERPHVRLSAVRDLGRHAASDRSGRALSALRETLAKDASVEIRGAAALSLADAEARTAAPALVRALEEDAHEHVRQMALLALGELGTPDDPRIVEVVRAALEDTAPALRFQALIACHKLHTADAEAALLAGTEDADAEVRHLAFRLLEERATSEDGVVSPSDVVRKAAYAGLSDSVLGPRLAAAILLARSGDDRGNAVLAEAVSNAPDARGTRGVGIDPEDEQTAIVLAGERSIEAARPGLARRAFRALLGKDRFSYEARIALARLGDERARRAISVGLRAWSRDARTLAVVAAGRAGLVEARGAIETMRGDAARAEPEAVEEALLLLAVPGPDGRLVVIRDRG
ncbi:MAG TPA: HEAT repeat domain-containing protein, partial [Polyangiaceae bacterium]